MKTGDILVSKWGYDQTNVEFYQVVKHTDKSVSVCKIAQKTEEKYDAATGIWLMEGSATPIKHSYIDNPFTRKVKQFSPELAAFIKINEYKYAELWGGKPANYTSYA